LEAGRDDAGQEKKDRGHPRIGAANAEERPRPCGAAGNRNASTNRETVPGLGRGARVADGSPAPLAGRAAKAGRRDVGRTQAATEQLVGGTAPCDGQAVAQGRGRNGGHLSAPAGGRLPVSYTHL